MTQTIFDLRQFVNWHYVDDGSPKPRKIPFNPQTGKSIDPHHELNWRMYDECIATGQPVGFVLTASDPYYLFDIDDALDASGQWVPEAITLYNQFRSAGAAAEVSISGKGMHLIGKCDQLLTANRKNKFGKELRGSNWLEFYTQKRFIALGQGLEGDFADTTGVILSVVPERAPEDPDTYDSDGPRPDYTGPADDDELIRRMCTSRGSINAQFGATASPMQLFEANLQVLATVYPSPSGDAFDRSSADVALLGHLAFWTGCDAERMDRIFRRSALMRDKWKDREDYRRDSIGFAVKGCKSVYNTPNAAHDLANMVDEQGNVPTPQAIESGAFLLPGQQCEYFRGMVYVRDAHRILMPDGDMLRPEQFKTFMGGRTFCMDKDGSKAVKNAFEAFTESQAVTFPKAKTTMFRPKLPTGTIINDAVNVYVPVPIDRKPGDVTPFLNLLRKMLPNDRDRAILLAYCASLVQNPGVKFQWAPVLQGTQGNGKTFIAKCLEFIVGTKYTHSPAAEDLGNAFNSYLEKKMLIIVEEVHLQGKRELLDILKPLITSPYVEMQQKGVDKRMVDNLSNWFFCTNHRDAVLKTKDDRRYCIFFTAQQDADDMIRHGMDGTFFPDLWDWAKYEGGYQHIADYLLTYDIPLELDPAKLCQRAPETSTTQQAITASKGRAEQELDEAIENDDAGFRNGWISSAKLEAMLTVKGFRLAPGKRAALLMEQGYMLVGRAQRPIMEEDGKKPSLWIRKTMYRDGLSEIDYCLAQGYQSVKVNPANVFNLPGARAL